MSVIAPRSVTIALDATRCVSGLLQAPSDARACYVLAHGAGAGMNHPFLAGVASELAGRGIATLRYQFPYVEQGSKRPDTPKVAQATVRAATVEASHLLPDLPLFAGGKSFGGRMTSQAQAESPLPGVHGLAFLGFPLHPSGRPSDERANHLFDVRIPMMFIQGSRDQLADLSLLQSVIGRLGTRAILRLFQGADHSFHVPARGGRSDSEIMAEIAAALTGWIEVVLSGAKRKPENASPQPPHLIVT